jgi:pilus assembly protein CpaE
VSIYKGLLITKDNAWGDSFPHYISDENLDLATVSEWKRSFREQQFYHFIFVDLDTVESPSQLQSIAGSVMIGLTKNHDFEQARTWLLAGAKDIIILPEEKARLEQAIREAKNQYKFQKETEAGYGTGEVHAFYSAKGGSGATLLSAIAAQTLSIHHECKVLLVDLNAQFGNQDVLFGIQPLRSYYDLIPVMDEMDMRHLQNISNIHEETGVTVLTGPSNPAQAENIPDELISRMIRTARHQYDYIILDLSSGINSVTFTGLNEATHIHYIMTPDSLGLRSYKYAEELFERFQIGRSTDYSLLLNRCNAKTELTAKDIEKITGREINGKITADFFAVQPFINMGESFYKKKKDKGTTKVSKDMKKYVEDLLKRIKG